MKVSRSFKENVLVVGFLFLSIAVVVILILGAWRSRTSLRSAPVPERVEH